MATMITAGPIHHIRMTVSDVARAREFYTSVLGFQVAAEMPPETDDPVMRGVAEALLGGVVLQNGTLLFGLRPCAPGQPPVNDRFDENRVGLDHVSFGVASRDELEAAVRVLDERGVTHGEIKDLPAFGIYVLAFRDPDNIQLELTAPHG